VSWSARSGWSFAQVGKVDAPAEEGHPGFGLGLLANVAPGCSASRVMLGVVQWNQSLTAWPFG